MVYTGSTSNVPFGLKRKLPRFSDRKWVNISQYGPIYDRKTPGLWLSPNGTFEVEPVYIQSCSECGKPKDKEQEWPPKHI